MKRADIVTVVYPMFERAKRQLMNTYLRVYPNSTGNELWQWCDIVAGECEPTSQRRRMALREQLIAYVEEQRNARH